MLNINAAHIDRMPFDGLVLISELMSFENSVILTHLQDQDKNDVLSYWVDYDISGERWLYTKITKRELFDFLLAGMSLYDLLVKIKSDYIFLHDYDLENNAKSIMMLPSKNIPKEYLPKKESYYLDKLPEFYSEYLNEFDYLMKLRATSFSFKISPQDEKHRTTVSAKDAAIALNGFTSSIEGYIKVTAYNLLKNNFGDVNKINKRINKLTNRLTPRIADTAYNSFEFWLAIDVVSFSGEDKFDTELRNTIVDGYKNDVIDVNYNSDAEAVIITEKYTEDERKIIYEPFIKVIENKRFKVSISGNKAGGKKQIKTTEKFKDIMFPKPTVEELQEQLERKNIIYQIVVNLKEGDDLTKLTKKDLLDNMLFTSQLAQTPYKFPSPVAANGIEIDLRQSLDCIMVISEQGNLQLFNSDLELFYESNDINEVLQNIKLQFIQLYQEYIENPELADDRFIAIKKYI